METTAQAKGRLYTDRGRQTRIGSRQNQHFLVNEMEGNAIAGMCDVPKGPVFPQSGALGRWWCPPGCLRNTESVPSKGTVELYTPLHLPFSSWP